MISIRLARRLRAPVVIGCLALALLLPAGSDAAENTAFFQSLQERLIQDGFQASGVYQLYSHPSVEFDVSGVTLYFVQSESKLNYAQFLEPEQIQKARDYHNQHLPSLKHAEKRHGVDSAVIVAILLVETRLGTYVGKRSVFNTLSTIAALDDPVVRQSLWENLREQTHLSHSEFKARADRKASWAYNELKAFLIYTHRERLNPLAIQGSYAGAMGYCQFMPSNVLTLAADGDGDGRIDLFTHPDAIMSIAGYLDHHGWQGGMNRDQAYRVVYRYNHSSYYVNTVLDVAAQLKG